MYIHFARLLAVVFYEDYELQIINNARLVNKVDCFMYHKKKPTTYELCCIRVKYRDRKRFHPSSEWKENITKRKENIIGILQRSVYDI